MIDNFLFVASLPPVFAETLRKVALFIGVPLGVLVLVLVSWAIWSKVKV